MKAFWVTLHNVLAIDKVLLDLLAAEGDFIVSDKSVIDPHRNMSFSSILNVVVLAKCYEEIIDMNQDQQSALRIPLNQHALVVAMLKKTLVLGGLQHMRPPGSGS